MHHNPPEQKKKTLHKANKQFVTTAYWKCPTKPLLITPGQWAGSVGLCSSCYDNSKCLMWKRLIQVLCILFVRHFCSSSVWIVCAVHFNFLWYGYFWKVWVQNLISECSLPDLPVSAGVISRHSSFQSPKAFKVNQWLSSGSGCEPDKAQRMKMCA